MTMVMDVTESARQMVQLWQEVEESGLLEQLRQTVENADPYLRQAQRTARQAEPPAELARLAVGELDPAAQELGRALREHRALVESAFKHAEALRAYTTELTHLWGRLAL
jgi:hypothetical protein